MRPNDIGRLVDATLAEAAAAGVTLDARNASDLRRVDPYLAGWLAALDAVADYVRDREPRPIHLGVMLSALRLRRQRSSHDIEAHADCTAETCEIHALGNRVLEAIDDEDRLMRLPEFGV